ncbi:hypothetical protein FACS1894140_5260 [Spirochaetia bacterium]|nr:hypothetical protein FACS1894140_5260 [Spirochaetia bacterium]
MQQTVDIPADRRIHLDVTLPKDAPRGQTTVVLTFVQQKDGAAERPAGTLPTIGELKREAAEKAAARQASGKKPFDALRASPHRRQFFGGQDGMDIQREMRSEWPD